MFISSVSKSAATCMRRKDSFSASSRSASACPELSAVPSASARLSRSFCISWAKSLHLPGDFRAGLPNGLRVGSHGARGVQRGLQVLLGLQLALIDRVHRVAQCDHLTAERRVHLLHKLPHDAPHAIYLFARGAF